MSMTRFKAFLRHTIPVASGDQVTALDSSVLKPPRITREINGVLTEDKHILIIKEFAMGYVT